MNTSGVETQRVKAEFLEWKVTGVAGGGGGGQTRAPQKQWKPLGFPEHSRNLL